MDFLGGHRNNNNSVSLHKSHREGRGTQERYVFKENKKKCWGQEKEGGEECK